MRCFQGILADDLLLDALGILGGPQHPLRADVVDRSQPHRQLSLSREHMPIGLNHSAHVLSCAPLCQGALAAQSTEANCPVDVCEASCLPSTVIEHVTVPPLESVAVRE